ncbi:MAG: PQQ-binding-like beta-propeller repeat protein [Bryobacteraceae bacterium]|nr:PQQ-binding-like beta-propeller repeat protein [Bryobacteraceae bacterium]
MTRLVLLAAVSFTVTSAADWPRFLGPNADGTAAEAPLPLEFGPSRNLIWKTPLPFSHSSPIVTGDRVFLTASDGGKLITFSLDRESGRILWRREVAKAHPMTIYKANDPATPSPVSDGSNVYVFFPETGLISYGPDGNERWRMALGPFQSFYGLAASPVLHGDKLLLQVDAKPKPFLIAVDRNTGKQLWRADRKEIRYDGYSTPVVHEASGQVIALGPNRLDAYSLKSGERIWFVDGLAYYPIASPVIRKDAVLISTWGMDQPEGPGWKDLLKWDGDKDGKLKRSELPEKEELHDMFGAYDHDGNGFIEQPEFDFQMKGALGRYGALSVRLGGRGDVTATHVLWHNKKDYSGMPTPVLYRDVLYFPKTNGVIVSVDPESGKVWKAGRSEKALGEILASPVAGDGKVYFVNGAGKVIVLKAGPQWEIAAINDLGQEVESSPAIAGGRLFIRTKNGLWCFGSR